MCKGKIILVFFSSKSINNLKIESFFWIFTMNNNNNNGKISTAAKNMMCLLVQMLNEENRRILNTDSRTWQTGMWVWLKERSVQQTFGSLTVLINGIETCSYLCTERGRALRMLVCLKHLINIHMFNLLTSLTFLIEAQLIWLSIS